MHRFDGENEEKKRENKQEKGHFLFGVLPGPTIRDRGQQSRLQISTLTRDQQTAFPY